MEFVEVYLCIYCNKEVNDKDLKYCCMWTEYVDYTGSEDFTCSNFKKKVANSYKAINLKNTIKRKDVGYEKPDYGFDLFLENSIILK